MRQQDTAPELMLQRSLRAIGLSFRTHDALPGSPDITFRRSRVAVFIDGTYWHSKRTDLMRDRNVDKELGSRGWVVLRFSDAEVLKDPTRCVCVVGRILLARNRHLKSWRHRHPNKLGHWPQRLFFDDRD